MRWTFRPPLGWCHIFFNRRAGVIRDIEGGALIAANVAATVLFTLTVGRALFTLRTESSTIRCSPRRDFPDSASEGFDLEPRSVPLSARLAGPVKGTQSSVDDTLIGLGSKFVGGSRNTGAFQRFRSCRSTVGLAWIPMIWIR